MSVDAPNPAAMHPIDYAEHTVEVPAWSAKQNARNATAKDPTSDEDTVVLAELSPQQVDELLSKGL